jgi:transaldolase
MNVKIFADGADFKTMSELNKNPIIKGFTTNPTLFRRAGVKNYESFANEILVTIQDKPVSFEVIADDFVEIERQAKLISGWGDNVYVKIPVMLTDGTPTYDLIGALAYYGIKQNVTAIMDEEQVEEVAWALGDITPSIVSVFAGRIADTGRNVSKIMENCVEILWDYPNQELLWASCREVYNIIEADECGCDIITVTPDLIEKMKLFDKNLYKFSQETVQMFYKDAIAAGYEL